MSKNINKNKRRIVVELILLPKRNLDPPEEKKKVLSSPTLRLSVNQNCTSHPIMAQLQLGLLMSWVLPQLGSAHLKYNKSPTRTAQFWRKKSKSAWNDLVQLKTRPGSENANLILCSSPSARGPDSLTLLATLESNMGKSFLANFLALGQLHSCFLWM